MALNRIACPECGVGLKSASGFTVGETVCCSKCETYFAVEQPAEAEQPNKAKAQAGAASAGKKPVRAAAAADDDDDYDDQPKKKKRKDDDGRSYKNSPARYAVLAVLIVVMCVLGYLLYDKKTRENEDTSDNGPKNNQLIPPEGPIPPQPVGLPKGGAAGGPGGAGKNPNPKNPNPKNPNPKLPKNPPMNPPPGGGSPFDIFGGGQPPTAAEADMLTKKYRDQLIGTWKADIGNGFTVELEYKSDGTVTETMKTANGSAPTTGKWTVSGLNGRKGLLVRRTGFTTPQPERLVFEGDELEHPVSTFQVIGIFRKK